nr:MAG TPA: HNH endonuclease [Caudoviricetes sp.]
MAQDFAKRFYNSSRWRKCAKAYAASKHYVCERCGNRSFVGSLKPDRFIVHHKILLTPENINDPDVTCNWQNLELLCINCHNAVHAAGRDSRECLFDANGNPIGVQDHVTRQ